MRTHNSVNAQTVFLNRSTNSVDQPKNMEEKAGEIRNDNEIKKNADKKAKQLKTLAEKTKKPLIKAKSVFPFDFFPDEISVDETKVNVIRRDFFASEDIHSVMIKLIKDIDLESGPFFSTLKIVPDGYPGRPIKIGYLKKNEAHKVRRIIQGLMVGVQEGIDAVDMNNMDGKFIKDLETVGASSAEY